MVDGVAGGPGLRGTAPGGARARLVADGLALATLALAVATVAGRIGNRHLPLHVLLPDVTPGASLLDAGGALLFAGPGWYLATRRPEVAFGWLALAAGLAHGLGGAGFEWVVAARLGGHDLPAPWVGAWLAGWGPLVELPVLGTAYALFPDGRLVRGRMRAASFVAIGLATAGVVLTVFDPFPLPATSDPRVALLANPLGLAGLADLAEHPELFIAPGMVLATAVVVVRWRRARGEQRRMLSWLALLSSVTVVIVPAVLLLPAPVGVAIGQGTTFLEVAVIAAAVLRHQVYGIDTAVNRTLVYALLTVLAAAVYGVAIAAGAALGQGGSLWWAFAGAVAVGLLITPARLRVQRLVNRFLYGERDDPFAVVSRVAAELAGAGSAEALLTDVADATAQALRVPYVAVRLSGTGPPLVFEAGQATAAVESFPVVHRGRQLGSLELGHRRGEPSMGAAERQLVEHLAAQVGVAAANVALTADLRRSRQRLVVAREEERRRLRRDLHDGLGPQLTGVALGLDVVAERVGATDAALGGDVDRLRSEVEDALGDIRRLVEGLRPPRLDDVGLGVALDELASRASRGGLAVSVSRPDELGGLDVATETAAYRIAAEAVTNAARHARAATCRITVTQAGGRLHLSVADDGAGLADDVTEGVGLGSMRERAEEIGGFVRVLERPGGGCVVEAELPEGPGR